MLRLVPFNSAWIQHDKLDLKAIYRRPRWTEDAYGEPVRVLDGGLPAWDLTGPLPVKQHNKWTGKGFEYVTLADRASLVEAAKKGSLVDEHGHAVSASEFVQDPKTGGPWNYRKYDEGQAQLVSAELVQIRNAVIAYGSTAYEDIRRMHEPGFSLPEWLKGFNAGDDVPDGPPTAKAAPTSTPAVRQVGSPAEMTNRTSSSPERSRRKRKPAAEVVAK